MRVGARGSTGLFAALAVVALLLAGTPLRAAESAASPRAAMLGYLQACIDADFGRAARFLDLRRVPAADADGARLARHLKFVLDRKLWIDVEALSEAPEGDTADGFAGRDGVGVVPSERGDVEILLERGPSGAWQIGASTVARIPALYDEYGLGPLGEVLPTVMFLRVGQVDLWQWLALIALVLVAYLISALLVTLAMRMALRVSSRTGTGIDDEIVRSATGPTTALAMLIVFVLGTWPLGLALPAQAFIGAAAKGLSIIIVTWLAVRLVDVAAHALEGRLSASGDLTAMTVIPVGRRITKVFLLVIAVLTALQNLGYNVLSILAGLGILGIAVAFAAQKTFENFFGALAILVDKPIQRGDFCRFGDRVGTIEDIGLRSTRVRTGDRTVVTIPNAEFSSLQLENFGPRDRIRFLTVLGLRYETSADQLRQVRAELHNLLETDPRVVEDSRVRFVSFGAYSLDLEVVCYIDTRDWAEFLAIREDLMLRMIDVVEACGTGFAFPSQTLYLGKDEGLDAERTRAAEEAARA